MQKLSYIFLCFTFLIKPLEDVFIVNGSHPSGHETFFYNFGFFRPTPLLLELKSLIILSTFKQNYDTIESLIFKFQP